MIQTKAQLIKTIKEPIAIPTGITNTGTVSLLTDDLRFDTKINFISGVEVLLGGVLDLFRWYK